MRWRVAYPAFIHSRHAGAWESGCRGPGSVNSVRVRAADSVQPVFDSTQLGFSCREADTGR